MLHPFKSLCTLFYVKDRINQFSLSKCITEAGCFFLNMYVGVSENFLILLSTLWEPA
jgi:hypothetical protein